MNIDLAKIYRVTSLLVFAALIAVSIPTTLLADGNVFKDPKNFAEWTVVGPDGGDVRAIAIDPKDPERIYISTLDGQIHSSSDGGRTWQMLVNLDKPQLVIDDMFVDSRDSNVIYAAGHRHKAPGGFFKSKDGGKTWKESKELRNESIHAMTQSESDPENLFVGTTSGVWVSRNSGDDWEKISSGSMPINVNSLAIDPRSRDTIFAGTWWRAYKSTDAGKSWKLIKDGMIDDSDVFAIDINERNRDHIFASACSGIYESLDGGEKWKKIQGIPSTSRRTRAILQHPSQPGTVYAGTTEGFWMSVNGGKTWSMTTQKNLEINKIAVHRQVPNRVFIATNNNGVMVSNDGGKSFSQTNQNFTSRFAYSVTADVSQPGRLYATTHNTASSGGFFFVSSDGGANWQPARGLDMNKVSLFSVLQDRIDPNRMFLGTNLGIFRSLDRGASWTLVPVAKPAKAATTSKRMTAAQRRAAAAAAAKSAAAGPKLVPGLTEKVKVLAFTEDEKNGLFAGTDNGLFRTYDISKGWEKLSFGAGVSENVFAVYSSPLVPGTIWVGTATSGVLVSRDDGKTWEKTDGAPQNIPVISLAGDPKRPNYIYAGTTQSLYLTRDGGRSWTRRGGNLPLGKFTSILINPENTDELFVASSLESDGGIYYSDDAGNKWRRVDSKEMIVPSRRVWALAFDPVDRNRIFAASHSSGIYRIQRIDDSARSNEAASSKQLGN
ncbi:MAG TPA: YCF48-related protein [Pyrinomonadaceae bacterium]|nr:hypothetical protein [Chloracidobacterium sp.]HBE81655.1 hypothetical protein [Blastocatellia bacterium]HRJ90344.1 YCF48-related protein [Pyrinomonadaceae bacterium]HRK49506.1 YCF48-related protein [Pyrinomonadaceae bacterium]